MVAVTHHLRFLCGMLALGLLPACATVGVRKAPPPLPADPFERALMAYVRGDLEQATADLQEVIRSHPEDLRARDLLQAVYQEKGGSLALSPPPPLTLLLPQPASPERIMQIVLGRNPEIRKAIFQIIEARARLREAQVDFGPEFSLLTRFHPLGVFTTLTQSILDGIWGRKARMHQAEEALLASVANYARVRMAILDSALNSYLQFLEAEELIEVLKAELQVREEQRRVASLRSQHGTLLSPDLLAIEQGLAATQQKLAEARKSLEVARTTLNGLMGRRVDAPLSLQPKRVVVAVPEDVRQAITRARSQRPELQEAQAQLAEAQAGHEIIRTRLPRLELRTTYGASSREGRGDFLQGASIGVRFSTPLLIWPLQKARSAREAALVKQLEMEVAAWQTRLAVEAVEAYQKLQEAQKRFVTAVKQSEEAREALRIARAVDRWGKGEERFTLLAAQIKQSEAHQQLIRRDYAIQRASLQLQRVMGTLPERVIFTSPAPNRQEEDRSPRPHPDRALWAWHPAFLQEPQERSFFLDFAAARGIRTVFLFTSTRQLQENPLPFRLFLRLAHQRGLTVHALNGGPTWIFPYQYPKAFAFLRAVHRFHQESPPSSRFDAIHLDIEPYTLAEWKSGQQDELIRYYLAFLRQIRLRVPAGLPLVLDLPAWFDRIAVGRSTLFATVLSLADQVVLMAYQSRAEKVIAVSQPELEWAEQKGKGIWIGLSADPSHLSSATLPGEKRLETLIEVVKGKFAEKKSFRGVAIHDYERYQRLILHPSSPQSPPPPAGPAEEPSLQLVAERGAGLPLTPITPAGTVSREKEDHRQAVEVETAPADHLFLAWAPRGNAYALQKHFPDRDELWISSFPQGEQHRIAEGKWGVRSLFDRSLPSLLFRWTTDTEHYFLLLSPEPPLLYHRNRGGKARLIKQFPGVALALSPAPHRLQVLYKRQKRLLLWEVGGERELPSASFLQSITCPVWSPTGREIVFTARQGNRFDLYRLSPAPEALTRLTYLFSPFPLCPSWSPDGKALAFSAPLPLQQNQGIYLLSLHGTYALRLLAKNGVPSPQGPLWLSEKQLLYVGETAPGKTALYQLDLPSSLPRLLRRAAIPLLYKSPAGDRVAYHVQTPRGIRIRFLSLPPLSRSSHSRPVPALAGRRVPLR